MKIATVLLFAIFFVLAVSSLAQASAVSENIEGNQIEQESHGER
jgi:outer membrane lipoprotein-sorting protein